MCWEWMFPTISLKMGDGLWCVQQHPCTITHTSIEKDYLLLCLFFLSLFLRLCVAILCPFFFLPFGIAVNFKWFMILIYICSDNGISLSSAQ